MAEDKKIVTKKTAAKAAATTKKVAAKATTTGAGTEPVKPPVGAKKTVAKPATPKPAAAPAAQPAPAPKPATASPAPRMSSPPPAKKTVSRKTVAKKAPAPAASPAPTPAASRAAPSPQPPLEEKPVSFQQLGKVTPEQRLDMIREAAYYRAEKRDFAPGNDAEDWAEAEREIDELIAKAQKIYGV